MRNIFLMILFPNGKINLGLTVLQKRADGFHDIDTVMYPVPVYDVLEFLPSRSFSLKTYGFASDAGMSDNIVYKAWSLLHNLHSIQAVAVKLLKNIPTGSGLGGGSADATFFLKALNDFFGLSLTDEQLFSYALQLGSDCPFFLKNNVSLVQGRGEIIRDINIRLHGKFIVIVFPGIRISTADAYKNTSPGLPDISASEAVKLPMEQWRNTLVNDFENYVFKQHPELKNVKNTLYDNGAVYASMTGSGSAFFGIFNQPIKIKHKFPDFFIRSGTLN